MDKYYTFRTKRSQEDVYGILKNYFKINGYYEISKKEGLNFQTYEKADPVLSPQRFPLNFNILYKEFPGKTFLEIKVGFGWLSNKSLTEIDEAFFEDFLNHIKNAVETGVVEKFDTSEYNDAIKSYSRIYGIIIVVFLVIGTILHVNFKDVFDSLTFISFVIIAPSIAIFYINWRLRRKKKAHTIKTA